jgi:spore maturation protein CgeB
VRLLLVGDKLLIPLQKAFRQLNVSADFLDHRYFIRKDNRLDKYRSTEKITCSTDYDFVICFGEWVDISQCRFGKIIIYWANDTHCYSSFSSWIDSNIENADIVLCSNYNYLKKVTTKPKFWMPIFNWDKIKKLNIETKYDVVFIGSYNSSRRRCLDIIKRNVNSVFFSDNCWGRERELVLNSAKLVFNPPLSEIDLNLAPRVLFTLAIGKCQLLKGGNINNKFLKEGTHYVGYEDPQNLVDKVRYLLDNPKERIRIEQNALQESKKHTAKARAGDILKVLENLR